MTNRTFVAIIVTLAIIFTSFAIFAGWNAVPQYNKAHATDYSKQ